MAEETQEKGCAKTAIVITGVVMALILVVGVVLVVIPGFMVGSRASAGRNAYASLRTIITAEADFRMNDRDGNGVPDYWTGDVRSLYYLSPTGDEKGRIKLIEPSVAEADFSAPPGPYKGPKSQYWFCAVKLDENGAPYDAGKGRHSSKFAFCVYPAKYHQGSWPDASVTSTTFTFIVNEEGTIWKKDIGGQPVQQWPKDPKKEGWTPID